MTALRWTAAAALATCAWLLASGPIQAFLEFAMASAFPIAAGRTSRLVSPRSRTAATLAAALAATGIFILDLYLLRGTAPIPGMLGAAIGYWLERRRLERGEYPSTAGVDLGTERSRRKFLRRLLVGVVSALFAIFCIAQANPIEAADVRAEWQIRSFISGAVAAWSLVGALLARIEMLADR